ncbi:carboxypeptidase-like regulatory domain-containing protein [Catalinimonas sp. 4WD22]|uniref:carboxypeptidase-like regulatory domain-containing protein n=1 Tax=Catalinimonas locisalis TaxID=3133978 RepID=UPI003101B074
MLHRIVLISVLLLISFNLVGQPTIEGIIKDGKSMKGLAYVNVGVVGKNVGTVTDSNGKFQLIIDEKYDDNELRISMVGYESKTFKVAEFKQLMGNESEITLDEAAYQMDEVFVYGEKFKGRKLRERILGNETESRNNKTGFDANLLGNEMGIVIKTKRRPTFIKDFSIYITDNDYNTFKFRINFYNLRNGLPDQNILKENIIVTSSMKEGKLTVDLSQYNIVVEDDFFVSMEWIEDMGDHGLFFSTDISGAASPTITRTTSQGKWREVGKMAFGTGIGITTTVQY